MPCLFIVESIGIIKPIIFSSEEQLDLAGGWNMDKSWCMRILLFVKPWVLPNTSYGEIKSNKVQHSSPVVCNSVSLPQSHCFSEQDRGDVHHIVMFQGSSMSGSSGAQAALSASLLTHSWSYNFKNSVSGCQKYRRTNTDQFVLSHRRSSGIKIYRLFPRPWMIRLWRIILCVLVVHMGWCICFFKT